MDDNIQKKVDNNLVQALVNRIRVTRLESRRNSFGLIRIGRNEPCPCGKTPTKKYKNCCGKENQ